VGVVGVLDGLFAANYVMAVMDCMKLVGIEWFPRPVFLYLWS
jgi:hypothetical protein